MADADVEIKVKIPSHREGVDVSFCERFRVIKKVTSRLTVNIWPFDNQEGLLTTQRAGIFGPNRAGFPLPYP